MKVKKNYFSLLVLFFVIFFNVNQEAYSCSVAGNPYGIIYHIYYCYKYCSICDKCDCSLHNKSSSSSSGSSSSVNSGSSSSVNSGNSSNNNTENSSGGNISSEGENVSLGNENTDNGSSNNENSNNNNSNQDSGYSNNTVVYNFCDKCGVLISDSATYCSSCSYKMVIEYKMGKLKLSSEEKKLIIDSYYIEADFILESMEKFAEEVVLAEIEIQYSDSKIKEIQVEKAYFIEMNKYKNRKEELEAKYKLEGDPVKIVNGEFFQSEIDFSTNSFEINRIYQSYNKVVGNFGEGFLSILDEGIIHGVDFVLESELLQYENLIDKCNLNISNAENFLLSTYDTKNYSEINKILEENEKKWNENYSGIISFLEESEKLLSQASSTELYNQAFELKKEAEDLLNQSLALKEKYDEERKNVEDIKDFIINQKQIKENAEKKLEEEQSKIERNLKVKSENTRRNLKNIDESFYENGINYLTLIEGSSNVKRFKRLENESVFYQINQDESFSKSEKIQETSNGYVYYLKNGGEKRYNREGFLIEIIDVNGNQTVFVRKNNNQIEKVTTAEKQEFYVFYDNSGFVSKIKNPFSNKEYSYEYKKDKLVKVITPENLVFEYVYDSENGLLEKFIKPDGSFTEYFHEEKDLNQRVFTTSTKNEEGFFENFDFYPEEKKTIYTNQDREKIIYHYDENGNIIKSEDSAGNLSEFSYDSKGRILSEISKGVKIEYFYNSNDDLSKRQTTYKKENGSLVTSVENFSYDNFGNVTNYIDGDGVLYSFIRDLKGNMIEYKIDNATILTLEYNDQGFITKSTVLIDESTGNQLTREIKYDDFQNIIQEKTENYTKTYQYDSENRLIKSFTNDILDAEITYSDFITTIKEKNGLETVLIYNNRFDLIEKIEKDTLQNITHRTEYLYDLRHLLTEEKIFLNEEDFEITQYRYSSSGELLGTLQMNTMSEQGFYQIISKNGNIKTVTDGIFDVHALKNSFHSTFDKKFSQWTEEELDNLVKNSESSKSERMEYLSNQNAIILTDALGRSNLYKYNFQNNLESIEKYGENETVQEIVYEYSTGGKIIGEKNQYGGESFYGYSSSGLLAEIENQYGIKEIFYTKSGLPKKIIDGEGFETEFFYNNQGLVENVKSYDTNIYYFYDDENRLVKQIYGESPKEKSALSFTKIEYSEDNRKIFANKGDVIFYEIEIDGFGNVISVKDSENNVKKYEYDGKNQLVNFVDGYGNSTKYLYNSIGNIEKIIYPDGNFEKYSYNEAGFVTKIENCLGISAFYQYDSGNRLVVEKTLAQEEKTYKYDYLDRIVSVEIGNNVVESYEYSDAGKTIFLKEGGASKSDTKLVQKLDDYGKKISEENSYGKLENVSYDKNGNILTVRNKNNISKSIRKNFNSQEYEEVYEYSDGSYKKLTYDKRGRLVKEESDNSKNLYVYNQGDLLVQQTDLLTGETTTFSYDKAGRKIKTENSNQKICYEYGKNSELLSISDLLNNLSVTFEYDSLGREVGKIYSNGTREITKYDEIGRVFYRLIEDRQKNILFGEGYYYEKNGYLRGKVNHQGKVTLYDYDDFGQLRVVYLPISSDLENSQKTEIKANGGKIIENQLLKTSVKYLTYEEITNLQKVLNYIQVGWGNLVSSLQYFNIEIYEYDFAGNISSKENPFGKIFYQYDAENRLIGSFAQGSFSDKNFYTSYEYDDMGNLLSEKSLQKEIFYTYNNENRVKSVLVLDHLKETKTEEYYEYDTFGRRILHQINDEIFLSCYEGFTFNVLFEKEYKNSSQEINLESSKNSSYRFRFIQENKKEEVISTNSYLYNNDKILAKTENSKVAYYTRDVRGSTVYVFDNQGFSSAYDYDSFGKPILSELYAGYEDGYNLDGFFDSENTMPDFVSAAEMKNLYKNYKTSSGYAENFYDIEKASYFEYLAQSGYSGKKFNLNTYLNDYGLRDYASKMGRFITEDPIRDGSNWYSFSRNNPVNFVDSYGLLVSNQDTTILQNSDEKYKYIKLGTGESSIYDTGCVLTTYTRIANTLGHVDWPLDVVNQIAIENNLFTNKDELSTEAGEKLINILLNGTGQSVDFVDSLTGSTTEIAIKLFDYMNADPLYMLTARIKTSNLNKTKMYEHSLSVMRDCVVEYEFPDGTIGYNIKIDDTSNVNRKQIYDDVRLNELMRIDVFEIKSLYCNTN